MKKNVLNAILILFYITITMFGVFTFVIATDETDSQTTTTTEEDQKKEEELDEHYDKLKKLEKKEKKYRDIINLKQKEQEIINAQIKKIENENFRIEKNIKENESKLKELQNDIERAKKEIIQKEAYIKLQKQVLKQFLREKYQNYSKKTKTFAMLNLTGNALIQHGDRLAYTTEKVNDYVSKIHEEQNQLRKEQEELENKTKEIEDIKYELEQKSAHLESSRDYKKVLASQVDIEENKYQTKLSKVLEEQLAIQQEISSLSTNQIGNFSLADLPSKKEADFEYPMKKPFKRTQGYGKTSFSSHYKGGMHNGIDLVAQGSQSIIAPAKGKVKATGNMGRYGYGKWVAVDHGNGLITLYGHMSKVKVSRGDKLKQGEKIGTMGNTGFSTGPHLHFSVFAGSTFEIVESSSVKGVYIPTGATVNPDMYL